MVFALHWPTSRVHERPSFEPVGECAGCNRPKVHVLEYCVNEDVSGMLRMLSEVNDSRCVYEMSEVR